MKPLKIISLIGIFLLCFSSSCKDCGHRDNEAVFFFAVLEDSGSTKFMEPGSKYNLDTFKILNEKKETLDPSYSRKGRAGFNLQYDKVNTPVDQDVCRKYYVYFNENDIDSLNVCLKINLDECEHSFFKESQVFYNNQLKYDGGGKMVNLIIVK